VSGRQELPAGHEQCSVDHCAPQVSASEVRAQQVGVGEVRAGQVRADQQRSPQVGPAQVLAAEVDPGQVGAREVARFPVRRPRGRRDLVQHRHHVGAQALDLGLRRLTGRERLGPPQQDRDVRTPAAGLGEVPRQLVHLLDQDEGRQVTAPGHRLAGPEAVVGHTPAHPGLDQPVVDATPMRDGEVAARRTGRLVESEVRRRRERQHDAAQSHAPTAVGGQLHPPILRRP